MSEADVVLSESDNKPKSPEPTVVLRHDGPPRVPKLALYAAVPSQPLMMQFDAGFIARPSSRDDLQAQWKRASEAYSQLPGPERSFLGQGDARGLVGVDSGRIAQVLSRARLYPPFDSHPVEILAVRTSKIVTAQLTINLARAAGRASVPHGARDADLFEITMSSSLRAEPVHRQTLAPGPNQGAVLYTTYDEDVRPHNPVFRELQVEPRDSESQVLPSFCIPVGGGIPFVQGHRISLGPGVERVLLANGFHRAYAIAAMGAEWIPIVLTRLQPVEVPPQFLELPSQILLNPSANPPVLTDYLDPAVAMQLDYYPVLKTVRVNWAVEQVATVLH